MSWFKVDDGFATSKPVLRIPRRYRLQVVGLWTLAGTWSAKELTDGFIPDYVLEEVAGTPALAGHLVRVGLWETAVQEYMEGWQYIGWKKYQPMRAEVMAKRDAEADRKRKYREQKAQERAASENVNDVSGDPDATVTGSNRDPGHTDLEGHESASVTPLRSTRPVDQHGYGMSQWDTEGTAVGLHEGQSQDSALPDPTRPDPSTYYVSTHTALDPEGHEYPATTIDIPEIPEVKPVAKANEYSTDFEEWWSAYPGGSQGKGPKAAAWKEYRAALRKSGVNAGFLLDSLHRYLADPNRDPRFIPYGRKWLGQEQWEIGPLPAQAPVYQSKRERQTAEARQVIEKSGTFAMLDRLNQPGLKAVGA